MIDFIERNRVRSLGVELFGSDLKHVIERIGSSDVINVDLPPYDSTQVKIFKAERPKDGWSKNEERRFEEYRRVIEKHNFGPAVVLMEAAAAYARSVEFITLELGAACFISIGGYGESYAENFATEFFDMFNDRHPIQNILPIIFPPIHASRILELVNIGRFERKHLHSILFEKVKSISSFRRLVDTFAEDHPYFRIYPIYDE